MPLVFGVMVVMPLVPVCVPLGSVKSTVPPALRVMLPRLKSSGFDVPMRKDDGRTARIDRQAVEPLAVGGAEFALDRQGAAAHGQGRGIARLLMMLVAGAPGWLKSSLSVPAVMVVAPV